MSGHETGGKGLEQNCIASPGPGLKPPMAARLNPSQIADTRGMKS